MRISHLFKFAAWGLLAAIVFVTVCPIQLRPPTETSVDLDRALAFALTGAALALAYPRRWVLLLALLPLGAYGIETLQFLSVSRHPQFADATFKAIGGGLGILAGSLAFAVLQRIEDGFARRTTAAKAV